VLTLAEQGIRLWWLRQFPSPRLCGCRRGKICAYQQADADPYTQLPPGASSPGAKTALLAPDAARQYVSASPGEGKMGAKVLVYQVN